jgi:hypothetical protein
MKAIIRTTLGIWLLLFFICLPLPFSWIPELGIELSKLFKPLTKAVSGSTSQLLEWTHAHSDSLHLYWQSLFLGLLSIPIALISIRLKKRYQLELWLHTVLSYNVAFFLIKYGMEKWTHLQFPQPPPNILHAETGSLDKDMLFWTVMGTSTFYLKFMGVIEVLAGALLLFHKTRFVGAFIAIGIFSNIFAINLGFDISVKLLSLSLLLSALFIAAPILTSTFYFLTGRPVTQFQSEKPIQLKEPYYRVLKSVVIVFICIETIFPVLQRPALHSNSLALSGQSFEILNSYAKLDAFKSDPKYIHFHPGGSLIMESGDNTFRSFNINLPAGARQFKFTEHSGTIIAEKVDNVWLFRVNETMLWRCKRIKNEQLRLLQDDFHWTVESMMRE